MYKNLMLTTAFQHLGPVRQLAFLTYNIEKSVGFWTRNMGVGPFFLNSRRSQTNYIYRGAPMIQDLTWAVAYLGEMQIELIQPSISEPSIFLEWLDAGNKGVHHVCFHVEDVDETREHCTARGWKVVYENRIASGDVIFADPGTEFGMLCEILKPSQAALDLFAKMQNASVDWDGSDPIRQRQSLTS